MRGSSGSLWPQAPPGWATLFPMAAQYIYTMRDLRRFYPPDREVLKGINLSFYPGAKIGVIGSNGSGKSSLLQIMAGEDDGFTGEARLTAGFTVGYLAQEPQLDPDQGRARQRLRRGGRDQGPGRPLQRGVRGHGRARRRLRQAAGRAGRAPGQDRRRRRLGPRADLRHRHGRPPPPAGRRRRHHALRWGAPSGGPVPAPARPSPTSCCSTSPPTTSTPSRWPGWSAPSRSTRAPWSPSPTTATSSTTWPAGSSSWTGAPASPGRGTTPRGWSRSRPGWPGSRSPTSRASGPCSGSWSGSGCRPGPARARARPASTPTTTWWPRPRPPNDGPTTSRSPFPPGPRLGDRVVDADGLVKGYGDRLLIDGLSFLLPPGGIVGVIGPNGAGKTTLFRMIVGEEKPDGGQHRGRLDRRAGLRRPVPGRAGRGRHRLRRDHRRRGPHRRRPSRAARPGLRGQLRVHRQRPAEEGRAALRRRAQPGAVGQGAEERWQRAAARRAHQRPRRRHAPGPRGGSARVSRDAWSSSATTGGSSTGSPPMCWPSRGTPRSAGGRGTSATTRRTARSGSVSMPTSPTGIRYKPLARRRRT